MVIKAGNSITGDLLVLIRKDIFYGTIDGDVVNPIVQGQPEIFVVINDTAPHIIVLKPLLIRVPLYQLT
ncbi:hypothetical protein D3C85_1295640 [compost metagenome]